MKEGRCEMDYKFFKMDSESKAQSEDYEGIPGQLTIPIGDPNHGCGDFGTNMKTSSRGFFARSHQYERKFDYN